MTRKPQAFRLDDPHVILADEDTRAVRGAIRVMPEAEHFDLPVPVATPLPTRRRFPWGAVFWSALGGLVSLGLGLATTRLIEDLYARVEGLGAPRPGLAAPVVNALLVFGAEGIARPLLPAPPPKRG